MLQALFSQYNERHSNSLCHSQLLLTPALIIAEIRVELRKTLTKEAYRFRGRAWCRAILTSCWLIHLAMMRIRHLKDPQRQLNMRYFHTTRDTRVWKTYSRASVSPSLTRTSCPSSRRSPSTSRGRRSKCRRKMRSRTNSSKWSTGRESSSRFGSRSAG